MTALVVYDSAYGNTARIAEAVRAGLGPDAQVRRIGEVEPTLLGRVSLLVVGCPTQGGRPTAAMQAWLDGLSPDQLGRLSFAAFDTRIDAEASGFGLKLLMGILGYAAPRMASTLAALGAMQVTAPRGFIVTGKEGPLAAGELENAEAWGASLIPARVPSAA